MNELYQLSGLGRTVVSAGENVPIVGQVWAGGYGLAASGQEFQ